MAKVFISYRRGDTRYQARHIFTALTEVLPRESIFMDIDSISPGANFRTVLQDWVSRCDIMLVLMTENWAEVKNPRTGKRRLTEANDFVRIEVASALERSIPVVPILIDAAELPSRATLPRDLRPLLDRQAEHLEFRTFDQDVQNLVKRLRLGDPSPIAGESQPAFINLDEPARQANDRPAKEADLGPVSKPARPIELLDPVEKPAPSVEPKSTPVVAAPVHDLPGAQAASLKVAPASVATPAGDTPTHETPSGRSKYLALAFAIIAPLVGFGLRVPLEVGGNDLTFLTTGVMLGIAAIALWLFTKGSSTSIALLWLGWVLGMWTSLIVGQPSPEGPFFFLLAVSAVPPIALAMAGGLSGNAIAVYWLGLSITGFFSTVGFASRYLMDESSSRPWVLAYASVVVGLVAGALILSRSKGSTKQAGFVVYLFGGALAALAIFLILGVPRNQTTGSAPVGVPLMITIVVVWPFLVYRAWRNRQA